MAVIGGQTDRFGNKIPPNQSVKVFINADGTVPQQRETVSLPASIVATDDPVTQATALSLSSAATNAISSLTTDVVAAGPGAAVATIQPGVVTNAKLATMPANTFKGNATGSTAAPTDIANTGTVAGRLLIPVLIDTQNLSAVNSYTSPSWTGNLYRSLKLVISVTTGTPDATILLTGLSGTYNANLITSTGSIVVTAGNQVWLVSPYANGKAIVDIECLNGDIRSIMGRVSRATGTYQTQITGTHDDTTHNVTGLTISFTANVSGKVWLEGIPA